MSMILALSIALGGGGDIEWKRGKEDHHLPSASIESGRITMVYFRADWDRFSHSLDEGPFSDKAVVALSRQFRRILIDCTDRAVYRKMRLRYRLEGLPSVLFLDPKQKRIGEFSGFVDRSKTYLQLMKKALEIRRSSVVPSVSPTLSQDELVERIFKRVKKKIGSSMKRVRTGVMDIVRKELNRAKLGTGKPAPPDFDKKVDVFADKIKDDKGLNTRLKKILKTKKGKVLAKSLMGERRFKTVEEGIDHYFDKNRDGTYSIKSDYEEQLKRVLDRVAPEPKSKPKKKTLDEQISAFAGKIKDDKGVNSRLKKFLKTKKGVKFAKQMMDEQGMTSFDEARDMFFRKNKDSSYSIIPEYEGQIEQILDNVAPKPKKKSLDDQISDFADKIKDDKGVNTGLRKFLKTKVGKEFVKEQMETLGAESLDEAIQFYFDKKKDGTYAVKKEYEDQLQQLLDQMGPLDKNPKKTAKVRLGFSDTLLTEKDRKALGLKKDEGIKVGKVSRGGPCAKAGMQVGDIILSIGDSEVGEKTIRRVLGNFEPGDKVTFVVLREGKRVELRVVLGTPK